MFIFKMLFENVWIFVRYFWVQILFGCSNLIWNYAKTDQNTMLIKKKIPFFKLFNLCRLSSQWTIHRFWQHRPLCEGVGHQNSQDATTIPRYAPPRHVEVSLYPLTRRLCKTFVCVIIINPYNATYANMLKFFWWTTWCFIGAPNFKVGWL